MVSKAQYINTLKKSLSILKDEVDNVVLNERENNDIKEMLEDNDISKYLSLDMLTRAAKLSAYIQTPEDRNDESDIPMSEFIEKYKNNPKLKELLEINSDIYERISASGLEELLKTKDDMVGSGSSDPRVLLGTLSELNEGYKELTNNGSSRHLSLIEKSVKTMYIGISVGLIGISIFLIRYVLKSDFWQRLKETAKQGNWQKLISILKGGLSLGLAIFPAVLGVSILIIMFVYKKDEYYLTKNKVTQKIEDFFLYMSGLITRFIIVPMIKLLNRIKFGKGK